MTIFLIVMNLILLFAGGVFVGMCIALAMLILTAAFYAAGQEDKRESIIPPERPTNYREKNDE